MLYQQLQTIPNYTLQITGSDGWEVREMAYLKLAVLTEMFASPKYRQGTRCNKASQVSGLTTVLKCVEIAIVLDIRDSLTRH